MTSRWLLWVIAEWAVIGLAMASALVTGNPLAYLIAVVIVGTRQHAISVLGHDTTHGCVHRNRRINDALGALCFWPLGVGVHGYRRFHLTHHANLGTHLDPERRHQAAFVRKWTPNNVLPGRRAYLLVTDLFGWGWREVLMILVVAKPVRTSDAIGPAVTIAALAGLLIVTGHWQAVAIWYAALYTTFWASFRQRCLEEHIAVDDTRLRRTVPAMWQRLLYLPHLIWLHHQHHAIPGMRPELFLQRFRAGP